MLNDTILLAVLGLLGTMIGVVVWLVKSERKSAQSAQEALTTTLQGTITNQEQTIKTYGEGFKQLTETMQSGFTAMAAGRDQSVGQILQQGNSIQAALDQHSRALEELIKAAPPLRKAEQQ